MLCNDRSSIKVDEAQLYNKGFWDYPCYDQLNGIFDNCGADLFEPLFEMYKVRLMSGNQKVQGFNRNRTHMGAYSGTKDRKTLHY